MPSSSLRRIVSASALFLMVISCSTLPVNNVHDTGQPGVNNLKNNSLITGKVEFPGSFKTKAVLNDVAASATVSLINPTDNITLATGVTDSNNMFIINPGFSPALGNLYILEASNRIGGPGNFRMGVRTYVQWTSSGWKGITRPDVLINIKTTALSIMAGTNPQINPSDLIGKLERVGDESILTPFGAVTESKMEEVVGLINTALFRNQDPIGLIYFTGLEYVITSPGKIEQLLPSIFLYTGADNNLYRMNENGSQKTRVANALSSISTPILLSDRDTILYMDNSASLPYLFNPSYASGSSVSTVYAYSESTSTKTDLTAGLFNIISSGCSCPYLLENDTRTRDLSAAPDGSKAAFRFSGNEGRFFNNTVINTASGIDNPMGIYVVTANGTKTNVTMNAMDLYNIASNGGTGSSTGLMNDYNLYWSPDSSKILFQGKPFNNNSTNASWFVTNTSSFGSAYYLNNPMNLPYYNVSGTNCCPPTTSFTAPKFSPDSSKIGFIFTGNAYSTNNFNTVIRNDIFVSPASGGFASFISAVTSQTNDNFSFSPNSEKVAWTAKHTDFSSTSVLYVASNTGGTFFQGSNGFCQLPPSNCPDSSNPDCPAIMPVNCHDSMSQFMNPTVFMSVCNGIIPPDSITCPPGSTDPGCEPLNCPGDANCPTPFPVNCNDLNNSMSQLCTSDGNPFKPGPMACSGSDAIVLARDFTNLQNDPVWSPDNTKLAVTGNSTTDPTFSIYLVNPVSAGSKVKISGNITISNKPFFSKDSQKVIFEGSDGSGNKIYSVNASFTSSTPSVLSEGSNIISTHPTKDRFLFEKDNKIHCMKEDGTNIVDLDVPGGTQVKWYPDGKKLYYSGSTGDVYVVNPDTGVKTNITNTVQNEGPATFFERTQ